MAAAAAGAGAGAGGTALMPLRRGGVSASSMRRRGPSKKAMVAAAHTGPTTAGAHNIGYAPGASGSAAVPRVAPPKPAIVQRYRTGYTRLVHVREFGDACERLLREWSADDACVAGVAEPDLSVDELTADTPTVAVQKAIDLELADRDDAGVPGAIAKPKGKPKGKGKAAAAAAAADGGADDGPPRKRRRGRPRDPKSRKRSRTPSPAAADEQPAAAAAAAAAAPAAAAAAGAAASSAAPNAAAAAAAEAVAAAVAATAAAAASVVPAVPALRLPFGARVPKYDELLAVLQPLAEQRRAILMETPHTGRKQRVDGSSTTRLAFDHDVATRVSTGPPIPIPAHEVVLKVRVFHALPPYRRTHEFVVLGSQPLTALRDRMYCLSDLKLDGASTPSSCLFVEGRFYDDLRDRRVGTRAPRYSDAVLNWVRDAKEQRFAQPGLSHFEAAAMADTTFNDLNIRLGSHYLYQHQGDCCHVLQFTALRRITPNDVDNARAYPLRTFQAKSKRRRCRVCNLYAATFVTYGDKLSNENPFFYCEECFRPLHYTPDGKLLYDDFQVFAYDHE